MENPNELKGTEPGLPEADGSAMHVKGNMDLGWENICVWWHNWRVRHIGRARKTLTKAMLDDPDFAHSWQCNIAMPIYDGAHGKLTLAEANAIADTLMLHLFDVPNTTMRQPEEDKR